MSDFLIELGKNPTARKLIQSFGLPIPMPAELTRATGPARERPLDRESVAVWTSPGSSVASQLARALAAAGATPHVAGGDAVLGFFRDPGEAYGHPPVALDSNAEGASKLHALVFDATELDEAEKLRALYDFFHPLLDRLATCGRVLVLRRPPEAMKTVRAAAAQAAVEGFVRSLAKEVGKKGSTAGLLEVAPGAEDRMAGPLRFFLSEQSAYVSGQVLPVTSRARALASGAPWTSALEGKTALVTGAARGIGAATARHLASEGARVVCLDRPADDGPTSQLAREIGGTPLLADVTDPAAASMIAQTLKEKHGGVDVVVHNAGITRDRTLRRMKPEEWDQAIAVNLDAVVRITSALADGVLRDEGRIVCLSSIAGIAGNMGQTNYAASKAGIIGLVRALSTQLAERGVTVNAIAPGFIETRLTDAMPVAIREVARRMNALGQGGRPEDVAQAITFLASPGAQGVTGAVLRVCGGAMVGA